ncbi:MAG: hypothetical protein Q9159_000850 [Coniocarpon cinnabarinum]
MSRFERLVRIQAEGYPKPIYADAILPDGVTDIGQAKQARVVGSSIWTGGQVVDSIVDIKKFLQPIEQGAIGTVRCLGLNYREHAMESKMPIPEYPILFYKPSTALAGPFDDIVVPSIAQQAPGVDYECELVAIIGKEGINIPESQALDHVMGYTVGNDVSHREWQLKRGGSQWSMGKCFDTWAPYGPGIISSHLIKDPSNLTISTKLNGQLVQQSSTKDLIFSIAQTVSFLSQGTTLKPGDMIWTGTPQGVGMGRSPQLWLKDCDIVEVSLEGVGTCVNKVRYAKTDARL